VLSGLAHAQFKNVPSENGVCFIKCHITSCYQLCVPLPGFEEQSSRLGGAEGDLLQHPDLAEEQEERRRDCRQGPML
jgi:hypothetical protein